MIPSSVLSAALAAPTVVSITEAGRAACPDVCPAGLDAVACAAAWEEVVPCRCTRCHAPVEVSGEQLRELAGLPPPRPRGTPNRVRVVDLGDAGLLVVPEGAP